MVGGKVSIGQARREPVERAQMRFRECRLVHAGLVGTDRAQRVEIGEHALAVEAIVDGWHGRTPDLRLLICVGAAWRRNPVLMPSRLDATEQTRQTIS